MQELILAVREQKPLGFVFSVYFAEETNKDFYTLTEPVHHSDIDGFEYEFNELEKKIIEISDSYSKKNLAKIFAKGVKSHDFIKTISEDDINKRIRPFIEERLVKIIRLLHKCNIKLFHKADSYNVVHKEDEIKVHKEPAKTIFNITKEDEGTKYFLSVKHSGREMHLNESQVIILSNNPCLLILNNNLYIFDDIDGKKLVPFLSKEHIIIHAPIERKWFEAFAVNAIKKYEVNAKGFKIIKKITKKKAILTLEKDWNYEFVLILSFKYDDNTFVANSQEKNNLEFDLDKFEFIKFSRDFTWENSFDEILKKIGLFKQTEGIYKICHNKLNSENRKYETILWLNENINKLAENDIEFSQNIGDKKYFTEKILLKTKISEKKDWFDLQGVVTFGNYEVPFLSLRQHIISGEREFVLPDGSIAIIPPEWFLKYSKLMSFGKEENDILEINKHHFTLIEDKVFSKINKEIYKGLESVEKDLNYEVDIPEDIRAELRPYQKEGYKKLYLLQEKNFGACLADDMGLGKTLQTITLLQKTIDAIKENTNAENILEESLQLGIFKKEENKKHSNYKRKASLIVMPVSLIHNWENEIMKFSPFLKVLKYRGSNRDKKVSKFNEYDIILTGYGIVRNDIEILSQYEFLYVILDESQFVKNPDSKAYKAVSFLVSNYKLILTGTPIENSLSDLWAQLNFINKGMLGSLNFFKDNFQTPIEKNNNPETKEMLKKLINPFIIRRTKDQVAKDLPSLSEQIMYCTMSDTQKELYESEKSKIRNFFLDSATEVSKKDSAIMVIQALMKLRQIANHPNLAYDDYNGDSGKFNDILRDIENIISENHKVLIFSSFVKHLEIFENYFMQNDILYSKLTGKTANREKAISEFQENADNNIFLISIKAGGIGLNLTEADYVFILDPWWNPAVEKQAVNRAHRIGQDKNVMVYRYITLNTVEEKIKTLQEKKLELSEEFITSDNPLKNLSTESILEFFE